MRRCWFVSHPNVVIDAAVPVPQWPLSELGSARMRAGLRQPWVAALGAIHCSSERKALDAAQILAAHRGLPYAVHDDLGENDRASTGFLAPPEFEATADAFFARPEVSIRGWERALDAQRRIVAAVQRIAGAERAAGDIAFVSHGAVGTLLYCWLTGQAISRRHDQPPNGGGNFYAFALEPRGAESGWTPLDA